MISATAPRRKSQSKLEGKPSDIEILQCSVPDIGRVVLATVLSEAYEPLRKRDHDSPRCLVGVAPVTKQSGKAKYVVRRRVVSRGLNEMLQHWVGTAVPHDPGQQSRICLATSQRNELLQICQHCGRPSSLCRLHIAEGTGTFCLRRQIMITDLFDKNFKKVTETAVV